MNVALIQEERPVEEAMNAVIIYDAIECAARAKGMLERAAFRADATLRWSIKLWRLNLLRSPPLADAALGDAAPAHLIVLAVQRQSGMAPWVLDWLETWAAGRQVPEAALALSGGQSGDGLPETARPELCHFAERHGLGLISDETGTNRILMSKPGDVS